MTGSAMREKRTWTSTTSIDSIESCSNSGT
jgi:hypothetical protein